MSQFQKHPPETCSIVKAVFKNFAIFTGKHLCWSLLLIVLRASRPATFLKRDSNTGKHLCLSLLLRKSQVVKPANLLKGEYCKIFNNTILMKICEQLPLQFLLLTVNISFWVLVLIQQAFFKGPLQGLKSSPQGAQWQAPLLFEKKRTTSWNRHSLTFDVTRCTTRCYSLSLVVTLCHSLSFFFICYHSLSFVVQIVVTCCTTRCHSLSLVVIRCRSVYHLLSLVDTRCHSMYHLSVFL